MTKKHLLSLLRLIGILLFLLILFKIDRVKFFEEFQKANIMPLAISFAALFVVLYLKAIRWHILVKQVGLKPSIIESWKLYHIGYFLAMITPAKLGEFGRAAYLVHAGLNKRTSFGIAIIDRLADVIVTGVFILGAIWILFGWPIALEATLFSLLGMLIVIFITKRTSLGSKLINVLPFLRSILTSTVVSQVTAITVVHWFMYFTWAILIARSIGIDLPVVTLSAIFAIAGAVAVLPIAPSGLGTRDAALVTLLAPFGIPTEQAVALAFLMFTSIIVSGSLGACYWARGLSLTPLPPEHET